MKHKILFAIVGTAIFITHYSHMTCAQGPGGPEAGGAGSGSDNKSPAKPRTRWQRPLQLPEQYRSRDTDKDGQIGMYEWPRTDFATFRKLDLNRDGFLTADELSRGAISKSNSTIASGNSSRSRPSAAPAPTASGPVSAASAPAVAAAKEGVTAERPATSASETPTAPPSSSAGASAPAGGRSDAERQWDLLDKDKDGTVTEAEWGKSFLTRKKFNDAGITVSFPLEKDAFIQLYSQLPGAGK